MIMNRLSVFVIFIDTSTNEECSPTPSSNINNPEYLLIRFRDVCDVPRLTATSLLPVELLGEVFGFM